MSLRQIINQRIEAQVGAGDRRGTSLDGFQNVQARCVGYDKGRKSVVVVNPFGDESSLNSTNLDSSETALWVAGTYNIANLLEVPWCPSKGTGNDIAPNEAMEEYQFPGSPRLWGSSNRQEQLKNSIIAKGISKEATVIETVIGLNMIENSMETEDYTPLKQCLVEITYSPTSWPESAFCDKVITTDPVAELKRIKLPNGSAKPKINGGKYDEANPVAYDTEIHDVDKLLEKLGTSSTKTKTTDRTLVGELDRVGAGGVGGMAPSITGMAGLEAADTQPDSIDRMALPNPNVTSTQILKAQRDYSNQVHTNPYDKTDTGPLYNTKQARSVDPYNVADASDPTQYGMRTDPQAAMILPFTRYGVTKFKKSTTSIVPVIGTSDSIMLKNPVLKKDFIGIAVPFGESVLEMLGHPVSSNGIVVQTGFAAPVFSAAAGTAYVDGKTITIKHSDELSTIYADLFLVTAQDRQIVPAGFILGYTFPATYRISYLTFEVIRSGISVDPLEYIPGW